MSSMESGAAPTTVVVPAHNSTAAAHAMAIFPPPIARR